MKTWYLGDGVYASFDGTHLTVSAERKTTTLTPALWYGLVAWIKQQRLAA